MRFTRDSGDGFRLEVEDDGRGIKKDSGPQGTGLGSKLIDAMARSLSSSLEFDPAHAGCSAVLVAPL